MKRALVLTVGLLFALSIVGLAGSTLAATKAKMMKTTGEVVSIDALAKTLTVKGDKGDMTFGVNDQTKIVSGKETKLLGDLKAGEKVTVSYSEMQGKKIAQQIALATPLKQ
jgi:Cu/Ag efflux protein CusF